MKKSIVNIFYLLPFGLSAQINIKHDYSERADVISTTVACLSSGRMEGRKTGTHGLADRFYNMCSGTL